ncbi:MAG: hypothetical protein EBX52_06885 [Proteobacteria bacterium]|nr:hypothetical protein [Pseudomonadota bacterium]
MSDRGISSILASIVTAGISLILHGNAHAQAKESLSELAASPKIAEAFTQILDLKLPHSGSQTPGKEINFDFSVTPFSKTPAGKRYLKEMGSLPRVRDQFGYPPPRTVFRELMLRRQQKSKLKPKNGSTHSNPPSLIQPLLFWSSREAFAMDDGALPGEVNCRASTSVSNGYFKAYFEDVALSNSHGYADPVFGLARRTAVCQVLQEIASLVNLPDAGVTPDILFSATLPTSAPASALASASVYYGRIPTQSGLDNGTLHYHIIARQDPTPGVDDYDAVVSTNWHILNDTYRWSVDVPLLSGGWGPTLTFDFNTVMKHELFHALGFAGAMSDSVTQTGVEVSHNTFNENSYSVDPGDATHRYFSFPTAQPLSPKIQAPNGAPSSWFVNNASIYQGTLNAPNAPADAACALYSPTSWEQGSSLSHFDMNRSPTPPGTVYVMHPSLGANTVRTFHTDELGVLCHLGYQVENLCDSPTPVATDDLLTLTGASQCVPLLQNDHSFTTTPAGGNENLVVYDLEPAYVSAGSSLFYQYFTASYDCGATGGTSQTSGPTGAKSILIGGNYSLSPVNFKYRVLDTVSNRISQPALVSLTNCSGAVDDYICNGNFELGARPPDPTFLGGNAFVYADRVPFWNSASGTPDLVYKNYSTIPHGLWNLPYTISNFPSLGNSFSVDMVDSGIYAVLIASLNGQDNERLTTRLKAPLTVGETYRLSMDVASWYPGGTSNLVNPPVINNIRATMSTLPMNMFQPGHIPSETGDMVFNQMVPISIGASLQWNPVSQVFTATSVYPYLAIYSPPPAIANNVTYSYIDNVSLKKVSLVNSISGVVYNDLNQNGSRGPGENELTGRAVGLYSNTSPPVLLQTANTSTLPPYRYTFALDSNYESSYLIALTPETLYQNITEPVSNAGSLIPGITHVRQISYSGGQLTDQNFGVFLNGQTIPVSGTATATPGCGEYSGSIHLTPAGGTPPYSYSWVGPGGYSSSVQDPSSLAPGGYSVTITDSLGAPGFASVTVPNPTIISVSGTVTQPTLQANGSIVATASGGAAPYSYTWSNGQITSSVSNLLPGSYTVTASDPSGCSGQANFVIVPPPLSISISSVSIPGCYGGNTNSIDLSVSGGTAPYHYQWAATSGFNGSTQQDIGNLYPGTYQVTVTDSSSPPLTSTYSATVNSLPEMVVNYQINHATAPNFNNGSFKLMVSSGGVPNFTYQFNGASPPQPAVAGPMAATSYTWSNVTGMEFPRDSLVKDSKNCLWRNLNIKILKKLAVTPKVVRSCLSAPAYNLIQSNTQGGHGTLGYVWKKNGVIVNGASGPDLMPNGDGVYQVTATDQQGQVATGTVPVTGLAPLHAVSGSSVNPTGSSAGSITVNVNGGSSPYIYTITPTGATSPATPSTTMTYQNLAAGSYSVSVKTNLNCSASKSFTLQKVIKPVGTSANSGTSLK